MLFKSLAVGWLMLFAQVVIAQVDTLTKPSVHQEKKRRLVLEVAAGYSATNFSFPKPSYRQYFLFCPYAEFMLGLPLTSRWKLKAGLFYQPIGIRYPNDYVILPNKYITSFSRLYYTNVQVQAAYGLSNPRRKAQIDVISGFFWGNLLQDELVSIVEPDHLVSRTKAIMTYKPWNGGMGIGLTGNFTLGRASYLGIKLIYNRGLTNILKRIATQHTGERVFTRSVSLAASFSF